MTNKEEVEQWEGHTWHPAIATCDSLLEQIIPGYRIAQIKEKWNRLRYYYDLPDDSDLGWDSPECKLADKIIDAAEKEVDRIQTEIENEMKKKYGTVLR